MRDRRIGACGLNLLRRPQVSTEGIDDVSKSGDDASNSDARLAALLAELEALSAAGGAAVKFEPADFEKDDDDNFHMDFITACTNLRATNYRAFPRSQQQRMMQRRGDAGPQYTTRLALPCSPCLALPCLASPRLAVHCAGTGLQAFPRPSRTSAR
jgi:hypothetical protein